MVRLIAFVDIVYISVWANIKHLFLNRRDHILFHDYGQGPSFELVILKKDNID